MKADKKNKMKNQKELCKIRKTIYSIKKTLFIRDVYYVKAYDIYNSIILKSIFKHYKRYG